MWSAEATVPSMPYWARYFRLSVVPGLMSLQVLAASHAIPLNRLAEPFLVTTGRHLREHDWPSGVIAFAGVRLRAWPWCASGRDQPRG